MNELMLQEIFDSPGAIRQVLPAVREQCETLKSWQGSFRRMITCGSGDSLFAAQALEYLARENVGAAVHALPALTAARYWEFNADDLMVAISISGETKRVLEAAKKSKSAGARLAAITGKRTSSLGQMGDVVVEIPFQARSRVTPHTSDYMTTLTAIAAAIEAMAGREFSELSGIADTVAEALRIGEPAWQAAAKHFDAKRDIYILGSGPHFGTVQYAAAKFWEAGGLRAFPFELEEFNHGPHMLLKGGDVVVILSAGGSTEDRAEMTARGVMMVGALAVQVTDTPQNGTGLVNLAVPRLTESWAPFSTAPVLQGLCWAVSSQWGYDVLLKNGINQMPEVYDKARSMLLTDKP